MNFLSPLPPAARTSRRRFVPRLSDDPDIRSVQIGIGATILVHLLLLVLMPEAFDSSFNSAAYTPRPAGSTRNFNIEMAPEEFVSIKPPPAAPPMKFVETNPDAPENIPDKTNNFAAQNQQAAQEQPAKKTGGDRPEMEGRKDIESTQIVTGQLHKQTPPVPSAPPQPVASVAEQPSPQSRREQNPLPGVDKAEGENPNNFGGSIAPIVANAEPVPQKVEGSKDAPLIEGATGSTTTIDPKHPQVRQVLNQRSVRPAIFSENQLGTKNIGMAAVDARWSNYGVYLQRMIETVQIQWDTLINEGKNYPSRGSTVTVKFKINSDGAISRIVNVDGGMSGPQAEGYCVSAITKPSPYGKWTDDMVAMLGSEQEMTFVFYYQ
jgi:hypothetical protein